MNFFSELSRHRKQVQPSCHTWSVSKKMIGCSRCGLFSPLFMQTTAKPLLQCERALPPPLEHGIIKAAWGHMTPPHIQISTKLAVGRENSPDQEAHGESLHLQYHHCPNALLHRHSTQHYTLKSTVSWSEFPWLPTLSLLLCYYWSGNPTY